MPKTILIVDDKVNVRTLVREYLTEEGYRVVSAENGQNALYELQHLQRLVEDRRTLAQADAGELSLNREPISLSALLERIARSYQPLAARQEITLKTEIQADLPKVCADPDRLAQVLDNLITNSLRYTPQGGEIVLLTWQEGKTVNMAVRDNGQGISPESLPYIFDRFYRADSSRTWAGESGLGLAIVKSIVEAHGGRVSVESTPGQGATFTIALPSC